MFIICDESKVIISGRSEDGIELSHHPKSFVWDPSMSNCLKDVINSDEVQNKLNSLFTPPAVGEAES